MEIITCNYCGKEFYRKPSHILIAEKHYCSNICRYAGRKNGRIIKCELCGKDAYKSTKNLKRSTDKKYFCSIGCRNIWYGKKSRREKHPNWKGGEFSYKEALKRHDALIKCFLCKTTDQRILAVHHIDHNRKNNNIENLMWLCHNCHFLVHHYSREKEKITKYYKNV